MKEARSRLIVALDLPDRDAAIAAVDRLAGHVGYFKLGLEIFVREGPALVEEIGGRGERVFLDLKLHDIPNTVAGAVRSACRLGIAMLTMLPLVPKAQSRMCSIAALAAEAALERPRALMIAAPRC